MGRILRRGMALPPSSRQRGSPDDEDSQDAEDLVVEDEERLGGGSDCRPCGVRRADYHASRCPYARGLRCIIETGSSRRLHGLEVELAASTDLPPEGPRAEPMYDDIGNGLQQRLHLTLDPRGPRPVQIDVRRTHPGGPARPAEVTRPRFPHCLQSVGPVAPPITSHGKGHRDPWQCRTARCGRSLRRSVGNAYRSAAPYLSTLHSGGEVPDAQAWRTAGAPCRNPPRPPGTDHRRVTRPGLVRSASREDARAAARVPARLPAGGIARPPSSSPRQLASPLTGVGGG